MGVEVKGAGDGVVIADRGCNDGCCCGNHNSGVILAGVPVGVLLEVHW